MRRAATRIRPGPTGPTGGQTALRTGRPMGRRTVLRTIRRMAAARALASRTMVPAAGRAGSELPALAPEAALAFRTATQEQRGRAASVGLAASVRPLTGRTDRARAA